MTYRYSKETRGLIAELYINEGLTVKEIRQELKKRKIKKIPGPHIINIWVNKGNWQAIRKEIAEKTLKDRSKVWVADRVKVTQLLQATITKLLKDYKDDKIKGAVGDIERLLKLAMQINGIPLDQTNIQINQTNTEVSVKAVLM